MGARQRREREGTENVFEEIIVINFLILGKETDLQFQEAQIFPSPNIHKP